ncbi:MAG: penicillin-insensitive murein endopeptidase [Kofleriaceae bacterium]
MLRTLVVILLGLLVAAPPAEARSKRTKQKTKQRPKSASKDRQFATRSADTDDGADTDDDDDAPRKRGQSFGLPWAGKLENGTRLRLGEGAHIRRPYRAFGTRTAVELIRRAINETIELYPRAHVLAVGDMSAEHGGQISDHHSHQSGRDIDLGLWYKHKPPGYPDAFISGTDENLDTPAMWTLISKLATTANKDGGVQIIYLDHEVQGVIYRWAKRHGVSDAKLERIFQYAHGRGAAAGIVRHYRNHANHIHVRFKCSASETSCS